MVAKIVPILAVAYMAIGIFYSSMAVLDGQGRPLPAALAFLCGAFLISPGVGYSLALKPKRRDRNLHRLSARLASALGEVDY